MLNYTHHLHAYGFKSNDDVSRSFGLFIFNLLNFHVKFVIYKMMNQAIGLTHNFQLIDKQCEVIKKIIVAYL